MLIQLSLVDTLMKIVLTKGTPIPIKGNRIFYEETLLFP